jgi:hypothetical protein
LIVIFYTITSFLLINTSLLLLLIIIFNMIVNCHYHYIKKYQYKLLFYSFFKKDMNYNNKYNFNHNVYKILVDSLKVLYLLYTQLK